MAASSARQVGGLFSRACCASFSSLAKDARASTRLGAAGKASFLPREAAASLFSRRFLSVSASLRTLPIASCAAKAPAASAGALRAARALSSVSSSASSPVGVAQFAVDESAVPFSGQEAFGDAAAAEGFLGEGGLYAPPAAASMHALFNSVVKVYSDYTDPNYSLPWQMQRQGTSTGSGFILKDRLIMTNAHCVSWNNRLQVRKHGSPSKYVARIVAVGHECDLALITVDDEAFWQADLAELELGDVPALQDGVVVLGYPRGGDNLCITSGVVSRVDVNPYAHSNTCLLCVQIDAAINPGNSGGPALKDGRVVGVAFQGFDNAQSIGYIVPTTVIRHFLEDVKRNGRYTGFPTAGIVFQPLENKSMQSFLGLNKIKPNELPPGVEASGILVTLADELRARQYARMVQPEPQKAATNSEAPGKGECAEKTKEEDVRLQDGTHVGLKKNDVILAVDGVDVANDGTVFFREMERVNVSHSISSKFLGDTLRATVLRNKKVMDVVIPLIQENALVPKHQWDQKARYLIYGGLVFCPLTLEYLKDEFGVKFNERAPASLLQPLADIFAQEEGEEPIILSHILASDLTSGYNFRNCLLTHVDGQKVRNMKQLAKLLRMHDAAGAEEEVQGAEAGESQPAAQANAATKDDFVIFLLENKVQLVLERSKAESMQPFILKQHAIHSPTSDVL
ncbi:serine protease [Besnoitia besnoiti]|uniref:Serine protease n=1 Tax=Besnoitia besnoiti TaxID=94643 RepID=A0A2A9M7Z9_BESBE|nr:serine protease [Besnoitia besnoiti]PFH32026.1 serine protease [Besnoitia besnoiti]